MKQHNKLAPVGFFGQVRNFLLNLAIAVLWIIRWCWRLLKKPFIDELRRK